MTLAPQSASWRTQVGPARTRVRSSTINLSSAREARGNGMWFHLEFLGRPTFPDLPALVYRGKRSCPGRGAARAKRVTRCRPGTQGQEGKPLIVALGPGSRSRTGACGNKFHRGARLAGTGEAAFEP